MNTIHFMTFIQFTFLLLLCFGFSRQQTTPNNQAGLSCNIIINGTCYIYVSTPMNWSDAEDNCISMGGHLASIHSDAENAAVHSIRPVTKHTYIGCNDEISEGNFRWTDGSDFSYTNWRAEQPDNYYNEDCCGIWHNTDEWNDYPCVLMFGSICKITVPGAPASISTSSLIATSISVTWTSPSQLNGAPIHYTVYYSGVILDTIERNVIVSAYSLSTTLTGLEEFTQYSIRVSASNGAGEGPAIISTSGYTLEAG